jgi:hypothetical protein
LLLDLLLVGIAEVIVINALAFLAMGLVLGKPLLVILCSSLTDPGMYLVEA